MSDSISPERRSWNMSRIRGKDTKIEVIVRQYLFSQGFRFRKNDKRYPGRPDIVLPKYHTIIFVNGCFWHQHEGCKSATIPKTRPDFWKEKLGRNVANDRKNTQQLESMGWNVITVWECELERDFYQRMQELVQQISEFSNKTEVQDE